jgi:alkyldihydroxyacetonephosphate synthase
MRRWNGWGEETTTFPLSRDAYRYLVDKIGEGTPLPDATLDEVLKRAPESRLPDHPLVSKGPEERVRHARGQSLPDWLALRSGNLGALPDGVAYPITKQDVKALIQYAKETGAIIIPYGGGTSVVGHVTPERGDKPVLTMDMGRMNRLINLDKESQIATFGAGVAGPDLEAQLRAKGYTMGHFPQSFEYSTLGGWIATRSSGQQSLRYGRIEQLFAGGKVETPVGTLDIPTFPASAAGPDLREVTLGSEGRLGILTEVKIRVTALPVRERFYGIFFPNWQRGVKAVRQAVQKKIPLSMLRLSGSAETETQLALGGRRRLVGLLEKLLAKRGAGAEKCMLVFGVTGTRAQCRKALRETRGVFKQATGFYMSRYLGRKWIESRFHVPYLRNTLWERGYAVDTLETATDWQNVDHLKDVIESALNGTASNEHEPIHVFTHLSHIYAQGASIYTTFLFRIGKTHEEALARWQRLKSVASEAIVANGGTISHQHGVGIDHAPYLEAEKGKIGMGMIKSLCRQVDPSDMMNPGKLLRQSEHDNA